MKVALLTDGIFPYVLGGIQKHSFYLAKYLARQKVKVILYHTGPADAETKSLVGFTKEELALIKPVYVPFPSFGHFPGHYLLESYKYSSLLSLEILRNEPVDLIYSQGLTGWKLIRDKKQNLNFPPLFVNLHGLNMYQYKASLKAKIEARILRLATDEILKEADYLISLGGKLTKILERRGVDKNKIFVQPIGIDSNWLTESIRISKNRQDGRKFVFIGRYDKVKGIEYLSHILNEMREMHFDFYFIGPIPLDKQLKQSNVHYLGLISDEKEIKKILRSVDVLVCPSFSEGMPTVILEAMASGLAIIATDVGAVSTMVSKKNGWLVEVMNPKALKEAIKEAISLDEGSIRQKKEASVTLTKELYTWERSIIGTIENFFSVLK